MPNPKNKRWGMTSRVWMGVLMLASVARGGEPFAYLMQIEGTGFWVEQHGKRQMVTADDLPLELDEGAQVGNSHEGEAVISLPKGRFSFVEKGPVKVAELNQRMAQPQGRDPGFDALKHFKMGGLSRGDSGGDGLAYPVEFSAVIPGGFVVELPKDWPAGPVALELVDISGTSLAKETVKRGAGERLLTPTVLRSALETSRGGRLSVLATGASRRETVEFLVLSAADEAKVATNLTLCDRETDPIFRHLRRAWIYDNAFLRREALAELVAARAVADKTSPRVAELAEAFAARHGLSLAPP